MDDILSFQMTVLLQMCLKYMSILRQYLVVVFRDKPLELWDIRTGTLLREMAKNFPTVTALVLENLKYMLIKNYIILASFI